ncbi:Nuclear-pore anchor [Frankliniella fusca]|uniref:Nuclear-pore anchor n=1 Tax=Frankliniella fusca TaxID=407009 RepID=A0AAE1L6M9_9NEOP|nr:Nuclear-pore anchor [Frankliniella fusca]
MLSYSPQRLAAEPSCGVPAADTQLRRVPAFGRDPSLSPAALRPQPFTKDPPAPARGGRQRRTSQPSDSEDRCHTPVLVALMEHYHGQHRAPLKGTHNDFAKICLRVYTYTDFFEPPVAAGAAAGSRQPPQACKFSWLREPFAGEDEAQPSRAG